MITKSLIAALLILNATQEQELLAANTLTPQQAYFRTNALAFKAKRHTLARPELERLLAKPMLADRELIEIGFYCDARIPEFCARIITRETNPLRKKWIFSAYRDQFVGLVPLNDEDYQGSIEAYQRQVATRGYVKQLAYEHDQCGTNTIFITWLTQMFNPQLCPLLLDIYEHGNNAEEIAISKDLLLSWGGFDLERQSPSTIRELLTDPAALSPSRIQLRYIDHFHRKGMLMDQSTASLVAAVVLAGDERPVPQWERDMLFRLAAFSHDR